MRQAASPGLSSCLTATKCVLSCSLSLVSTSNLTSTGSLNPAHTHASLYTRVHVCVLCACTSSSKFHQELRQGCREEKCLSNHERQSMLDCCIGRCLGAHLHSGRRLMISWSCWAKPNSNSWSASSNTTYSTRERERSISTTRCRNLPGVATMLHTHTDQYSEGRV